MRPSRANSGGNNAISAKNAIFADMALTEAPYVVDLPRYLDSRGNLAVIEGNESVPFDIKRTYWIYDVPGGEYRGAHAFRCNRELIVALSGSFDVVLDDGAERKVYPLNRSYYGLYVPAGVWRELTNFSTNSLALVLASEPFSEDDYIRDYEEFKTFLCR